MKTFLASFAAAALLTAVAAQAGPLAPPARVVVIDRQAMQMSGAANLSDLLSSRYGERARVV